MNIWIIGRSYPAKFNDMSGSFELEQAKMLAKRGNKVCYMAAVFHPYKKINKWGLCIFQEEVPVYVISVPYFPVRFHIHIPAFQNYFWRKMFVEVEKDNGTPDIIHVHYPARVSNAEPVLEYQKKGTKVVTTEHWSKVLQNKLDPYQRRQLIQYVNKADATLCVGSPLRDAVRSISGTEKEISIVPNVVSSYFKSKKKSKRDIFEFIVVGRLDPIKQMDKIVAAFSDLFKGNEGVRLTIVGGGKEKDIIVSVITRGGIQNQVEMTGMLSRKETANRVAEADSLICFSKLETFGVPVIEAWKCGLPTITSTTAAAVIDNFDERLGVEVAPDDIDSLKRAMLYIYEHIDEYDQEYISQYATKHFSEEVVSETIMGIYEHIGLCE